MALLTPFGSDDSIDLALLCDHANDLLHRGAQGITLFGTTGEGASIGFAERDAALAAILSSGIPAEKITVGLCATAVSDVVAQVEQAGRHGLFRFLLLPPFYFPQPTDSGLYEWHARLLGATDPRTQFIVYHIPQMTGVALTLGLVTRLVQAYPSRIIGLKDSSGNWDNTQRLLEYGEIPVLVGDERLLHRALRQGAVGSICGMANVYPEWLATLYETKEPNAALHAAVDAVVAEPVIPAIKLLMARNTSNANWLRQRAPLQPLDAGSRDRVLAAVTKASLNA